MPVSLIDAFDTVLLSEVVLARLRDAQKLMGRKQNLVDEKQWLTLGTDRLAAAREGLGDLTTRVTRLPELESVRGDLAKTLQNTAIDAVEKLQAGLAFHAGPRAPVNEELFGKLKLPALRRAAKEDFEKFITQFSKRLRTQYVKRIFSDPDFAFAMPAVDALTAAFESWRGSFSSERLPEAEEATLREQLLTAAEKIDVPLRQARLLAEAAMVSMGEAFAESGIGLKPKKRTATVEAAPAVEEVEETPSVVVAPDEAVEPPSVEVVEEVAPPKKKKAKKTAEPQQTAEPKN